MRSRQESIIFRVKSRQWRNASKLPLACHLFSANFLHFYTAQYSGIGDAGAHNGLGQLTGKKISSIDRHIYSESDLVNSSFKVLSS